MKTKRKQPQANLCHWAELVLPYLCPTDLASIALTCRSLFEISKSVTKLRVTDASRGLEKNPIPFLNSVDDQLYSYFIYTPCSVLSSLSPVCQPWGGTRNTHESTDTMRQSVKVASLMGGIGSGCDCRVCYKEGYQGCPCSLVIDGLTEVMTECGVNCDCGLECGNRLTQRGVSVRLKIVKDKFKGWGLHADQFIDNGTFVCEYAGELLVTKEARLRQQKYDQLASQGKLFSALLVVREHLPSGKACLRVNIDATRVGNIARFINHSCDGGNLSNFLVRSTDVLVPRLCFFAARDILEGEELCFMYGDVIVNPNGQPCFCGSSACLGVLPSEAT
ncbi:histone-lysine N-methyltransferase SUVR3 [Aristolochia californica]|uniref:histone-lysine N-methyltransferase SUVR3 n=1 Tax=Aristolochia californica TaxID=171875 RepID=UPI0035D9A026